MISIDVIDPTVQNVPDGPRCKMCGRVRPLTVQLLCIPCDLYIDQGGESG